MMFFITVIRALSAMIITNAHYTGVYPSDLIANGGLLGDVLFFAVSGYCLANVKLSFGKWYAKRILRIYPPVLLITATYVAFGFYRFSDIWGFLKLFVYPTYYHFIASILMLYIPFYFIMKFNCLKKKLPLIFGLTLALELIIYIFVFDRSTYHIDSVYSPMIWFLFFASMLIGAYVRENDIKYRNKSKIFNIIMIPILCIVYFASKMILVKYAWNHVVCNFQIANQFILLSLLYFIFVAFAGIDNKLCSLPGWIKSACSLIGNMTLEIYLVQYILIPLLNIGPFPVNWLIITAGILFSAFALHFVSEKLIAFIDKLVHLKN